MKSFKIKDIASLLIYWEQYKHLESIEQDLLENLKKAQDPMQREELYYLLLIVRIKKYQFNNILLEKNLAEYKKIIYEWLVTYETKQQLKSTSKLKIIFLKTVLSHISIIQQLWNGWENDFLNTLKYLQNELKKDLYKIEKKYFLLIRQILYKYLVGYGIGYREIFFTTVWAWLLFAFIYLLYDTITQRWALIVWVDKFEWMVVWSIDYYMYLSINILSNLWADGNLADTLFLRLLFWLEQAFWVMLFWIYVFMIWKKI